MVARAQDKGIHVCNRAGVTSSFANRMTINYGDTKTYPSWFTRATPATDSNAVTVTVTNLNLALVNGQYAERDGNLIDTTGTASSATYRLGLFAGDTHTPVNGFYVVLASNTADPVPTQTTTFHSLAPDTVYIVAVVVDDLEGETDTTRLRRELARTCIRTAASPS